MKGLQGKFSLTCLLARWQGKEYNLNLDFNLNLNLGAGVATKEEERSGKEKNGVERRGSF